MNRDSELQSGWTDQCERLVSILRDKERSWEAATVKAAVEKIDNVDAYRPFKYKPTEASRQVKDEHVRPSLHFSHVCTSFYAL